MENSPAPSLSGFVSASVTTGRIRWKLWAQLETPGGASDASQLPPEALAQQEQASFLRTDMVVEVERTPSMIFRDPRSAIFATLMVMYILILTRARLVFHTVYGVRSTLSEKV